MRPVIDLNNKYRVLLTEVLPYELPLPINNDGFYRNMQDDATRKLFLDTLAASGVKFGSWTIPFNYNIRRVGGERSRKMSLIHPITQLECVELYEKYDDYMINLCAHSPFSVRHIDKKAICLFPNESDAEATDDELERPIELVFDEVDKYYRSYFCYKKYDLIYKFFESGDNIRLEQKYSRMMVIDINGCFYHIYTHSVAWAVKGKEISKRNINCGTFENAFDGLMRHANYDETNGIVVGPEVSRIFAEIILQAVDRGVLNSLKNKYKLGTDYEIRRYVDDSYVYARNDIILNDVKSAYEEQLAFYKMDINKEKLKTFCRPFTIGVSDAKHQVNKLLNDFKEDYLKTDQDGLYVNPVKTDMQLFTGFAKHFRSITHQFQLQYGDLNKYTLTLLLRQIRGEMKRVPSQGLLMFYAEIAFYLFSLDMHTTASYRLCSIIVNLLAWADNNPDATAKQELENRVRRESKRVLDIYQVNLENFTNIEVLNLLTTLNRLIRMKIPVSQIEKLFGLNVQEVTGYEKLNYFQICTLLDIIETDNLYNDVRKSLETEIIKRFSSPEVLRQSEMAILLFDMMTCPYVSKYTCYKVLAQCNPSAKIDTIRKRKAKLANPGRWFYDWDKSHSISGFLMKKEYHSPYE